MFRTLIATVLLVTALAARVLVQAEPTPETLLSPIPVAQAISSCDALITRAMDTASVSCGTLDRNEACYGNNLVQAQLQANATASFQTAGDIAPLLSLKKVITTPLDEQNQTWGIAVFKAQANIPDTLPGQNVTFLLFGDTTVENPSPDMRAVTISTGIGRLSCNNAPPSALLIQSPEGQKVAMTINGADVTLGSTVYLTSVINQKLTLATIEGGATISAFGTTQTILPGTQVELPLGNSIGNTSGLSVIGPPAPPEPFDTSDLSRIPLQLLPRPVLLPGSSSEATEVATKNTSGVCVPRSDWTFTYVVRPNDSLSGIAARLGIPMLDLRDGNCIVNANILSVGQKLVVPETVPTPFPVTARPRPTTDTGGNNNQPPGPTNTPQNNNPPAAPTGPNFRVDDQRIQQGNCTTARWDSDNIKEIYFENQGVTGHGSRQVCPAEDTSYTLMVIWPDNSQHHYTVRVTVIPSGPVCGNNICEPGENSSVCTADCPILIG